MTSTITTDYREESNPDTMQGGAISSYRLLYWLKDILQNFMSDPVNIKDDRICKLLNMQDGDDPTKLNALFSVDVAYNDKTTTACRTPMIFISLGPRSYPTRGINHIGAENASICGFKPMRQGRKFKAIPLTITVMTEKYVSTVALTEILEDFLIINEDLLKLDNGMISEFHVTGVSEPEFVQVGQTTHAKCIYKQQIGISTVGGISWTTDTQGPTFRGITQKLNIK